MRWLEKDRILPAEPSTALITALFNGGRAGIVFSGPWFLGEIDPGIDYGLATLPTVDEAGGEPMRPWMTVEGAYIAAPSKHKEAAYELLTYLTDLPAATVLALEGRQTPANRAVYDDPKVAADAELSPLPQAGGGGDPHAQRTRDDHGLVPGDDGDERDHPRAGHAQGGDGHRPEGGRGADREAPRR
jgi:ABC-type glycerol-3-phosphate transport system substrate-binding protein